VWDFYLTKTSPLLCWVFRNRLSLIIGAQV
jgi:hypothetical protein